MNPLFQEFKKVSASQWEAKILEDLGISSLEELQVTRPEGIHIRPFYTSEDLHDNPPGSVYPGDYPFLRGSRLPGSLWGIQEDIFVEDSSAASSRAEKAASSGAGVVSFIFPERIERCPDVRYLFDKINPEETAVVLEDNIHPYFMWSALHQVVTRSGADREKVRGAISYDPLGFLTRHGDYPSTEQDAFIWEKDILEESLINLPYIRTLQVDGSVFSDAGATAVQEIAFALAMGKEYLEIFTDLEISAEDLIPRMGFRFATGPDYFIEIVKLRAFRLLWSWIVKAYSLSSGEHLKTHIHSRTALWNYTIYDPHVNMLRATTETMSAILGGADTVSARGYDFAFKNPGNFSLRIARNIQLILRYESYFNKIADPAAGSYYLEALTKEVAEKAWNQFLEVEKAGGYRKALGKGFIQDEVEKVFRSRQARLAEAKEVLIGTNRYPLRGEKFPGNAEILLTGTPTLFKNKKIRPLIPHRAAEPFEKLRLLTENAENVPRVFLLGTGNRSVRAAREAFSAIFFAVAGFEIIENSKFLSLEESIEKVNNERPEIVVICTGDNDYLSLTKKITEKFSGMPLLVIAGNPGNEENDLRKSGIKYFIRKESNILEILENIQFDLGIRKEK